MPTSNRLERFDLAGGCNGIDAEYSLPACTTSELMNSKDFRKYADNFRKEHCLNEYGTEDAKMRLPFDKADVEYGLWAWDGPKDEQDILTFYGTRRMRRKWTLGTLLARAMLQMHARLLVLSAADSAAKLPLITLNHKQRGEWLIAVIEYDMHLRQKDMN
ncbi:hypothetical protein MGN70_007730 [Eutypa lata]|uniref:Uncharacterized protein n=1 Tax=Eutypa lata (strain UCR-EL1) TaxID=1287681 RepID=M7TA36_EUTLA|nr:hypothetical protein UCREL1_6255 [Eutypa lata UCREL1]KAI1250673.1 hypothetical protein MGN70_007730 [Eutypa lata]